MRFYLRSLVALLRDVVTGRSRPPTDVEVMPTYLDPEPEPKPRSKAMYVCWCGDLHPQSRWHDPTHGQVDRDIQDWVTREWGIEDRNIEFVTMLNLQAKRNRGDVVLGVQPT